GVSFACTFVLGCMLCDPFTNPLMQRLDKEIERLLHKLAWAGKWLGAKNAAVMEPLRAPDTKSEVVESPQGPAVVAEDTIASWDIPAVSSSSKMQLKLKRSQRKSFTGKMIFVVDARMEIPPAERELIEKYRLGSTVIYDSADRQRHAEALK